VIYQLYSGLAMGIQVYSVILCYVQVYLVMLCNNQVYSCIFRYIPVIFFVLLLADGHRL